GLGGTFSGIGEFTGGSALDTLTGADVVTTWSITSNNGGTAGTIAFNSFENLTGGSNNDSFVFSNGVGLSGSINGGLGSNTLDYSAYTTAIAVNLQTATATELGGTFSNIGNFIGGSAADTLTGAN